MYVYMCTYMCLWIHMSKYRGHTPLSIYHVYLYSLYIYRCIEKGPERYRAKFTGASSSEGWGESGKREGGE